MERRGVDIIIPVYNALELLRDCYESVIQYTNLEKDHLVMIDDCSPDPAVELWLQNLNTSGVTVLKNESNLGFPGTVNRGMMNSERDVILLNSDTIVTANWVDKMAQCAYSNDDIATVTPFSNAATLCSVPIFGLDNQIPNGQSISEYADIIEAVSQRRYPEISVAVGFCMYIKRAVIDEVGYFDAETFKKGYGEENDFCWRASQIGYTHRLCDDTFVFHRGTASFIPEEKQELINEHSRIVAERYPVLNRVNEVFVSFDQNSDLRAVIDLFSSCSTKEKSILYILHADYHDKTNYQIGGTEIHVRDLENGLSESYNIIVAARKNADLVISVTVSGKRFQFRIDIGEAAKYFSFYHKGLRNIWEVLIDAFGISLVHVHHVLGLSLDIFDVCREKRIPVVFSLHDFYCVCPTITLVDYENHFCHNETTIEHCANCLKEKCSINRIDNYLIMWRSRWEKILNNLDLIISPSQSAKEIVLSYYPELEEKINVIPHGTESLINSSLDSISIEERQKKTITSELELLERQGHYYLLRCTVEQGKDFSNNVLISVKDSQDTILLLPAILLRSDSDRRIYDAKLPKKYLHSGMCCIDMYGLIHAEWKKIHLGNIKVDGNGMELRTQLNVATIGGISIEKGAELLADVIANTKKSIHWFMIGNTNYDKLLDNDNICILGAYMREQLGILLKAYKIDMVLLPSICSETYSYALSEAWDAGLPVIGNDIGAVGERIKRTGAGWTITRESTGEQVAELLEKLAEAPAEVEKKKNAICRIEKKSVQNMLDEYKCLYDNIAINYPQNRSQWKNVARFFSEGQNVRVDKQTQEKLYRTSELLRAREEELRIIKATKGYRLLAFARHVYLHLIGKE